MVETVTVENCGSIFLGSGFVPNDNGGRPYLFPSHQNSVALFFSAVTFVLSNFFKYFLHPAIFGRPFCPSTLKSNAMFTHDFLDTSKL